MKFTEFEKRIKQQDASVNGLSDIVFGKYRPYYEFDTFDRLDKDSTVIAHNLSLSNLLNTGYYLCL